MNIRKLRDYCLDPDNPRVGNKAPLFAAALGLAKEDAGVLKRALLKAARTREAVVGECDDYGQRYTVDFEMTTEVGMAPVSWLKNKKQVCASDMAVSYKYKGRLIGRPQI